MRYDLDDLRLFTHFSAEGSITGGARVMHLSLPSASARVRALEAQAGVPLLIRERRGVSGAERDLHSLAEELEVTDNRTLLKAGALCAGASAVTTDSATVVSWRTWLWRKLEISDGGAQPGSLNM